MPAPKTGLPVCQHILLGLQLLQARELLMEAAQTVRSGYAKSSKAGTLAGRLTDSLDSLRSELDDRSAGEHPANEDWAPNIYYGANAETWAQTVLPIWHRHQAGNPDCCAGMPEPTR
ncbi:hypothetical protein ACQP2Y_21030 [Actinoplanes sp. CA-051413]|uniref:hypothetical protein n=1 Tax=Actinoplanes sp. CA-051413 TaxID=3239899 RepID=UPI003D99376A